MFKKQTKGFRKKPLVVLFLITWLIFGLVNITQAFANDTYEQDKMRKGNNILASDIYQGNPAGTGDLTAMKGADVIGFDTLYGTSQRDTTYTGETPGTHDNYKDYPHMFNGWVGETWRTWWKKPEDIVDDHDKLKWEPKKTEDIHAYLLVSQSSANGLQFPRMIAGFVFGLFSILNAPFAFILRLIISFANFDVSAVSEALHLSDPNSKDSIARKISNAFTMDADNGNAMSPLLIVALAMFLIGLAGLAIRYIFGGKSSKHELLQEIGFCFIAFILIGVGATNGYSVLISKAGELTQAIVSGISQSQDEKSTTKLYQYKTNQGENADLNYYMDALTAKSYIETVIWSQFGYPADELYLWGGGDTQKLWGISESQMQTIVKRIGDAPGLDYVDKEHSGRGQGKGVNAFTVWTGLAYEDGNYDAPNVGYWWYAVTSGVDPYEPFTKDENGNIHIKKGDVKYGLLVMDLVSAVYATTNDEAAKAKCLKIMDTFYAHDWKWGEMGLAILVTIMLIAGIFFFSVFAFVFKLFFNIGFIIIPIIPILLLIKKTRPTARKILGSWISSAIIFSLCLICMCSVLYISSSLQQSGGVGIVVDFGLLIGCMVLAPRLVQLILTIPKKAGMEGLPATETVIQKGNQYMGSLQRNNRRSQREIQNKYNRLKNEKVHQNTHDMSAFHASANTKKHGSDNTTDWDNKAHIEIISKAAHHKDAEELISNLKGEEYEELTAKTGRDLAVLAATDDSEVLKKSGCSHEFVEAMEHKEKREKKKEERKEALEKRKEEVRKKRVEFYKKLHTSRTATLLSHSRLGNQGLKLVTAFEEKKTKSQEKKFERLAKNGYRSKLNLKDRKEARKEKKEIKAETNTLHKAEEKVIEGRAKLSSNIVASRIAEATRSHEEKKKPKVARIDTDKAKSTAAKIKEATGEASLKSKGREDKA